MVKIEVIDESESGPQFTGLLREEVQRAKRAARDGLTVTQKKQGAVLELDDEVKTQVVLINFFLTVIFGVMEYLVLDRFHNPNPLRLDYRNPYFQAWVKRVFIASWVSLAIVYVAVRVRRVRGIDLLWFTVASVAALYMVWIATVSPTQSNYRQMPGLASLWILMTIMMHPGPALANLIGIVCYYGYMSLYQG